MTLGPAHGAYPPVGGAGQAGVPDGMTLGLAHGAYPPRSRTAVGTMEPTA